MFRVSCSALFRKCPGFPQTPCVQTYSGFSINSSGPYPEVIIWTGGNAQTKPCPKNAALGHGAAPMYGATLVDKKLLPWMYGIQSETPRAATAIRRKNGRSRFVWRSGRFKFGKGSLPRRMPKSWQASASNRVMVWRTGASAQTQWWQFRLCFYY